MSLIEFVKEAGALLFGHSAGVPVPDSSFSEPVTVGLLEQQVAAIGVAVTDLALDLYEGVVTAHGIVNSQADREKIILALGNTPGVGSVDDKLTVRDGGQQVATFYTVKPGDTLSKIAESHYGDANKFPQIFTANQPMLKDPNRIYPGQVLRIPQR